MLLCYEHWSAVQTLIVWCSLTNTHQPSSSSRWIVDVLLYAHLILILIAGLWPWRPCTSLAAMDEGAKELSRGLRSQMPVQLNQAVKDAGMDRVFSLVSDQQILVDLSTDDCTMQCSLRLHATDYHSATRNWAYKWLMYSGTPSLGVEWKLEIY